jgi:membrane protein DedA with SNARE-associated domain
VERAVELPDEKHDALAGQAKDLAAGAVLLYCIGAVCVGAVLFWQPEVFRAILSDWIRHPMVPLLLAVYAAAAIVFVFKKREE